MSLFIERDDLITNTNRKIYGSKTYKVIVPGQYLLSAVPVDDQGEHTGEPSIHDIAPGWQIDPLTSIARSVSEGRRMRRMRRISGPDI